jgi:hypothetical protein
MHTTGRRDKTWTDAPKSAAFGELRPLLAAWEEAHDVDTGDEEGDNGVGEIDERRGLGWPPDQERLFNLLLSQIRTPILQVTFCNSDSMVSEVWTVTYSPEPDAVRREIANLLDRLKAGFERLSTLEAESD